MTTSFSKKKDGEINLAPNFKVREFACKDGSDVILNDDRLVLLLQAIRCHFNKPVTINSGYRTAAYNKSIGGAQQSQHMQGTAADIAVSGVTPLEVAKFAQGMLLNGGIGLYDTFTHVDVRAARSRWENNTATGHKEKTVTGW